MPQWLLTERLEDTVLAQFSPDYLEELGWSLFEPVGVDVAGTTTNARDYLVPFPIGERMAAHVAHIARSST